jgi:hypothetical protein
MTTDRQLSRDSAGLSDLFLDPDTGFFTHQNGQSEKKVLIGELDLMLRGREALIV